MGFHDDALYVCDEEGFYYESQDCRKYYQCINWGNSNPLTIIEFKCGIGTVFSKSLGNICVHPNESERFECHEVNSEIKFDSEQALIPNSQAAFNKFNSSEIVLQGINSCNSPLSFSRKDCEHLSSNSYGIEEYLQLSQYPNQSIKFNYFGQMDPKLPNYASSVDKYDTLSSSPDSFLNDDAIDICSSEGYFPDLQDCKKFYRCVKDQFGYKKFNFYCGQGTTWDPQQQICNYASKVSTCHVKNQILQSSISTSEVNLVTDTLSLMKNSGNMDLMKYNSTALAKMYLPASLLIMQSKSTNNDYIDNYSMKIATESSFSNCDLKDSVACEISGFYAHPTKCYEFYRCVDNGNGFNIYQFTCSQGTIFDPTINVCNHPNAIYPPRQCIYGQNKTTSIGTSLSNNLLPTVKMHHLTTLAYVTEYAKLNTETVSKLTSNIEIKEFSTTTVNLPTEKNNYHSSLFSSETDTIYTESSTARIQSLKTTSQSIDSSSTNKIPITNSKAKEGELVTKELPVKSTVITESPTTSQAIIETTPSQLVKTSTDDPESVATDQQLLSNATLTTENIFSKCPIVSNFTDEQVLLICPTGFKRHPKFCNIIYQCTTHDNSQIKILTLHCPQNTIFDETKVQCIPHSESLQPCKESFNNDRLYRRSDSKRLLNVSIQLF